MAKSKRQQIFTDDPSNLLQQAERLVYGARNQSYGHPSANFQNIANAWNNYLSAKGRESSKITSVDVASMNILQKMARISTNQRHEDSWLDVAGYAATAERIIKSK